MCIRSGHVCKGRSTSDAANDLVEERCLVNWPFRLNLVVAFVVLTWALLIFLISFNEALLVATQHCPLPEHFKDGLFFCVTIFIRKSDFCEGCYVPVLGNLLDTWYFNLGAVDHLVSESKQ